MPNWEQRIQRLEDRASLQDLAVRYFLATDDDDFTALADCFAPDATFKASGFAGGQGRDAIMDFLNEARRHMGQTVHSLNMVQLEFGQDGDAAGVVTAHLELGMAGQSLYGAVRYYDQYRRIDGVWRIASREMKIVHIGGWQDVATSLSEQRNIRWPGAEPQETDLPRRG